MGTRHHNRYTMIYVIYDEHKVGAGGIWDNQKGDKAFVDGFFPIALKDFLPPVTAAKILQYKDSQTLAGSYNTEIDGFMISLTIVDNADNNTRNVLLTVKEE